MQEMPSWMKWTISLLIGFAIILLGFRFAGWLLSAFFVMNCLVLMVVVLLQSGKAADLAGAFGGAGSQTAFGPRGAASLLSQATTWCSVMFMVCAFALVLRVDKGTAQGNSVLEKFSKPAAATKPVTKPLPAAPAKSQSTAPQSSTTPAAQPPATAPAAQPKKP